VPTQADRTAANTIQPKSDLPLARTSSGTTSWDYNYLPVGDVAPYHKSYEEGADQVHCVSWLDKLPLDRVYHSYDGEICYQPEGFWVGEAGEGGFIVEELV
jgi:hypothetical protein